MTRPGPLLLSLALAACGPSMPPGDSATDGTTQTSTTTTATTTSTSGSSGGTGTSEPATSTDTTAAPTTGPVGATGSTGAPASTSGSSSGGASTGDTGGAGTCEPALGDYGDCATPLGFAFDGVECTARSGCDCAPDCDRFFPDAADCALTCAAAGRCNPDRMQAVALAMDPIQQGSFCDELDVCPTDPALQAVFEQIFGMLTCEGMAPCPQGQLCHGLWQGELGADAWLKACAASLVEGGGPLLCVVFGP